MTKMKIAILTTLAMAVSGTSTRAADMVEEIAPLPSWTGCYVGVHVGGATGKNDTYFPYSDNSTDPRGPLGGAQAGCDYQINSVVLGGIVDVSFGNIDDSAHYLVGPPIAVQIPVTLETNVKAFGTLRARLGYAMDNTLLYATGGAAMARIERDLSTPNAGQSVSKTHTGWTIGGGVEHKFTENISVFGEYLYADFGKETYTYGPPLTPQSHVADLEMNIFKVGINYRF